MDASAEAVYGDIVLKFKNFLVEEGYNEISVIQNFIYSFSETVGGISMMYLILTLILGMVHEEPWLFILLKSTRQVLWV